MPWRVRAATIVVLLGTAIGFVAAAPSFEFSTKITDFLPDDSEHRGAQIAALLAETEISRLMVIDLTLGAQGEADRLRGLAGSLLRLLRDDPEVAMARSGLTEADAAAMQRFLGAWPATTFVPITAYTDDALRARLARLKEQLGGPMGMIVRQTAPRDPLGGMWEPLDALRDARSSSLVDDDGILMSADRTHAFVFVETRSSPFAGEPQRRFRATLDDWLRRSAPITARLQTSGTAQYTIAAEAQIKRDVNRIGIVSAIGILTIFLVLFGSVRLIVIGVVPMLFGSAIAVLACQALFGEIHGITIAFGTSLLGVGIDYVEHYYAHFVLTPEVPAAATMRRVAPSLFLGALTTIIGFIGIAASGMMALRQMAVFSMIAIVASMSATYWIVPAWMPSTYHAPRTLGLLHHAVVALLRRLTRTRWSGTSRLVLAGVTAIAASAIILGVRFSDNVNMLVSDAGPHAVDDRAVRSRLGPESSSLAVVTAADDDALLAAIGNVTTELDRAQASGALASFFPLGRMMPSRDEQAARLATAQAAAPRIHRIMEELEFVPAQFTEFWGSLRVTTPTFLTLADLRRSPLAPVFAVWVPAQAAPTALIPLVGVSDLGALRAIVPSATIVAPVETVNELFRGVRVRTVIASGIGFAAIFLLLLVRYRRAHKAVIALAPAVMACIATVGVLVSTGVGLTILHVMSLLLVVALGVDFGIFFVDTTETVEQSARTMVSILTASITTILSFGLLAWSGVPALAAIGVTVTLGVTLSLGFCLVIASLVGPSVVARTVPP